MDEQESHSEGFYKDADSVLAVIWIDARRRALEVESIDEVAAVWKEAHELYEKIRVRLDEYADGVLASYEFHKCEPSTHSQAELDKAFLPILGNERDVSLTAVVEAREEGGFHIYLKDVPGAQSQGETIREAERNILHALKTLVAHHVSVEEMIGPSPEITENQ
jgi:predicted RNase H-like HicB family nuclease